MIGALLGSLRAQFRSANNKVLHRMACTRSQPIEQVRADHDLLTWKDSILAPLGKPVLG
jgi:hypothetical protein